MRLVAATLAIATSAPALAKAEVVFPVSIPHECVELAQREGVPIMILNKVEAAKAKFKLARLKDDEPMVRECRAAVNRARQTAANTSFR